MAKGPQRLMDKYSSRLVLSVQEGQLFGENLPKEQSQSKSARRFFSWGTQRQQLPTLVLEKDSEPGAASDNATQADLLTGLQPVGDGAMWWDPAFAFLLQQAGLDSFEAVMRSEAGQCLRRLPERENWRLELVGAHAEQIGVYLKKHPNARPRKSGFHSKPTTTPGRLEAENVGRLSSVGLKVMRLVAFGEKCWPDGRQESFVMTEELHGFTPLDRFLQEHFPSHGPRGLGAASGGRDTSLDQLIYQVAQIVRQFHQAGYNHRDLYACHFFLREGDGGEYEIRLIDLQRVQHRRHFRRRWLVKDLAQLAWSIPADQVGCTQRLRFMKWYLGVRKLRPAHKRLIRRVLAKQQVLLRRLGPPT